MTHPVDSSTSVDARLLHQQQERLAIPPAQLETWLTQRDNLFLDLQRLEQETRGFPRLQGRYLEWSALGRGTAIQPLSSLQLVLPLRAAGTEIARSPVYAQAEWLKIQHPSAPLALFPDGHGYVSSTALLQSLVNYCSALTHYEAASASATGQVVCLRLREQELPIEIQPVIPVENRDGTHLYYLEADGKGNWQRAVTPPDLRQLAQLDAQHQGRVRAVIRLLKHWQRSQSLTALTETQLELLIMDTVADSELGNRLTTSLYRCLDAIAAAETEQSLSSVIESAQVALQAEPDDPETAVQLWDQLLGLSD